MYAISRRSPEDIRAARLAFEAACAAHSAALEAVTAFGPWSEKVLSTKAAMDDAGRAYREACGLVTA